MHQDKKKGAIVQCVICEEYTDAQYTFSCTQCKKSPLCNRHLERKYGICTWCAAEKEIQDFNSLMTQERSINAFLKLSQFVFLCISILFVAKRLFFDFIPAYLKDMVFFEFLFPFGGAAIAAMVFSYIVLVFQRKRLREIDARIKAQKTPSRYHFY
jgi:ribosomal protein L34E